MAVNSSTILISLETVRAKIFRRKFVQDVGILSVANIVGAGVSFAQGIIVARWLGPELYGVAALVISYPSLVYAFLDARSGEASVKFLSECHVHKQRDRMLAICKLGCRCVPNGRAISTASNGSRNRDYIK